MMKRIDELLRKIKALLKEGKEKEMLPYFEEGINLLRETDNKKLLIEFLNDYSGALRITGNYKKAIEVGREACVLIGDNYSKESEAYATSLMNLGNVYRMKGDYYTSEKLFLDSEKIFNKLNISNYSVAGLYNNISLLYQSIFKYEKAYDYQKKCVEINKTSKEQNIPLGISYNNLYSICKKLGKLEEAENYLKLAEEILRIEVGVKHPLYCSVLNNFADLYYSNQEFEKSLKLYQLILPIIKDYYGENSNDYLSIKSNYELAKKELEDSKKINQSKNNISKQGLVISEDFFDNEIFPLFKKKFPSYLENSAFGLVGEGSECFGFDDEISKDHDFGKRCCIWLSDEISPAVKKEIERTFKSLEGRVDVYYISEFYKYYTLYPEGPISLEEFRRVPTDLLAVATNGKVFYDPSLEFSDIRDRLLKFYPQDLIYKKMAFCLNKMAQSGQYNYGRCLKRGDLIGSELALGEFIKYYAHFLHLVNKKYMPFYKWYKKSLESLPVLGKSGAEKLEKLINLDKNERIDYIERLCIEIKDYLIKNKLSSKNINFLTYQADEVRLNIKDRKLREEDSWIK